MTSKLPLLKAAGMCACPVPRAFPTAPCCSAALAEGRTEIRDLLKSPMMWTGCSRRSPRSASNGRRSRTADTTSSTGSVARFPSNLQSSSWQRRHRFSPAYRRAGVVGGEYSLSGVARMHERPIGDPRRWAASARCEDRLSRQPGFPPLSIHPGEIRAGGVVKVRGDVSSQFLTALLMALPLTGQRTTVEVVGELISKPYIAITLALMARFGVAVEREGWARFRSRRRSLPQPGLHFVEGDASSASYFAAGAIGGGPVRCRGWGAASIQGDIRFAEALAQIGAKLEMGDNWIEASAPEGGRLKAFDMDLNHIPDAAMTLAVAALFADGPSRLGNIASWRVKETDRIFAMATELRKVGAEVEEGQDYLRITPPPALRHAAIDTCDDHRMAMCFSLASLAGVGVRINDPKCVEQDLPGYFEAFASVATPVPVIAIDGPSASGRGRSPRWLPKRSVTATSTVVPSTDR